MDADTTREASQTMVAAAWASVLLECPTETLSTFFPSPGGERDFRWALRTGEMLQQTRHTLSDGCYMISDVAAALGPELPEPERWQAMARLEELYLEAVSALSLEDPCRLKISLAQNPAVPAVVKRIVVAAVPDPTLLAIRALTVLAESLDVEILVHAPSEEAGSFDEWGRPLPSKWRDKEIAVPDPERNILLCASPLSQSRRVIAEIAAMQDTIGPSDVAVGVPDQTLMPYIEGDLAEAGLPAYDPSDKQVHEHRLFHLVELYTDLLQGRSYQALRSFVRHPDVLLWMQREFTIDGKELLTGLDRFQNEHLPLRLDDVISKVREGDKWSDAMTALGKYLGERLSQSIEDGLRTFLQDVYKKKRLEPGIHEDASFTAVAEKLDGVLRELRNEHLPGLDGDPGRTMSLFMRRLKMESFHSERTDSVVDLEGWLELPWNDASVLLVTGMNEGMVPDGRLSDAVLPDSLRRQLGLRHDESRLARDAFLMTTLIASREPDGRACFLLDKTSAAGDPLKPSRLLFRCPDDELVKRAELLFREVPEVRPNVASTVSFLLDPTPRDERARKRLARERLSVTTFRDYLACPFRFYLKHVLEMSSLSDDKVGMDELDFGTMVHAVLEEMGRTDIWRCGDASRLRGFFNSELDKWIGANLGDVRPLPVEVALDAARQRLGAFASKQVGLVEEGWEILHTEQKVEADFCGMLLSGRIDRVDRHVESGAVRVLDYKTSDKAKHAKEAHLSSPGREKREFAMVELNGKKKRWVDLQLPLYHHMVRAAGLAEGNIQVGYVNLPKAVGNTGVYVWEDFSEELLDMALACGRGVVEGIRNQVFWPPAERVMWDDYESVLLGDSLATVNPTGIDGQKKISRRGAPQEAGRARLIRPAECAEESVDGKRNA
jgi:ATP-dependent helicase/nuclease subunit B